MAATVPEQSQFLGAAMAGTDQVGAGEAEAGLLAWSRLPGQACKIPTQLVTSLESGSRSALRHLASLSCNFYSRGVSALAFSSDGKRLAVASANQTTATIRSETLTLK